MSKIGNLRSGSYGGGNLHTYDGKGKPPRKTLADVRKARELAQEKTSQTNSLLVLNENITPNVNKNQVTSNVPAIIQKQKNNFNFADILKSQTGAGNFNIPPQPTPNVPILFNGTQNAGSGAKISSEIPFGQGTQNLSSSFNSGAQSSNLPATIAKGASAGAQETKLEVIRQIPNNVKKESVGSKVKNGLSNLFSKAKGLFTKAKNFLKTPKGKWGLVIAGVLALGAGLFAYVADRFSDKNNPTPTDGPSKIFMPKLDDDNTEKTNETEKKDKNDKIKDENKEKIEEESDNIVLPLPVQDTDNNETATDDETTDNSEQIAETEETDKTEVSENDTTAAVEDSNIHKVIKGDNLWNIAKQNLKDSNKDIENYEPTDKEILEKTEELMKLNDKEYEKPLPKDSRKRVVLIVPDEEVKLNNIE